MPVLHNYLAHDGGWRQVQRLYKFRDDFELVRDWHRGETYWVPSDSLSPVTKYRGPQP